MSNAKCQNCGFICPEFDLKPIKNLYQRVAPGEDMPAGECPKCGALAHLIEGEPVNEPVTVRAALTALLAHVKGDLSGYHTESTGNLCTDARQALDASEPVIFVYVEGGIVQSVVGAPGTRVEVLDRDNYKDVIATAEDRAEWDQLSSECAELKEAGKITDIH